MYYAHFILNKKGPLAKIWLAAHWDKKLTKAQIYETNIESTIETILEPQMKLALRTSGHLLLGVCRIYSRKVKYLLADCNEAFVKIKLAFRPGLIDLPKEKQQASVDAITLPEKFPEFFVNFEDINMEDMDITKNITQQARIEDITLKEDFGTFVATQDDDFGDMGSFGMDMDTFMMSDLERGRRMDTDFGASLIGDNTERSDVDFYADNQNDHSAFANDMSKQNNIQPIDINDLNNDLNTDGLLADSTIGNKMIEFNEELDKPNDTIMHDMNDIDTNETINGENESVLVPTLFEDQPTVNANEEPAAKLQKLDQIDEVNSDTETNKEKEDKEKTLSTTDLDPIADLISKPNDTVPVAVEKQVRTYRRRRKLIIDEVKEIESSTMKTQLSDTSGILGQLELAPPTRRLMQLKETSGVEKMFWLTSRPLHNKVLQKLYTRNMITKSLADITNASKLLEKTITVSHSSNDEANKKNVNEVTSIVVNNVSMHYDENQTIEASMNNNQLSKSLLPSADSFIDNVNDVSKPVDTDGVEQENNNKLSSDLDEFDQFGGPASIFNTNLEDMLLDDLPQQINLEITPSKPDEINEKSKNLDDIDTDDEEDEYDEESKKQDKQKAGVSPNTSQKHHKRAYRRSHPNVSSNKENTAKEDIEESMFDDTLTNDPTKNLNKRAKTMVSMLNKSFNKYDNVGFFELTKKNGRKHVVQKFYSLLVLKKYEIIDLSQSETYGDIIISKGEKFENFAPN